MPIFPYFQDFKNTKKVASESGRPLGLFIPLRPVPARPPPLLNLPVEPVDPIPLIQTQPIRELIALFEERFKEITSKKEPACKTSRALRHFVREFENEIEELGRLRRQEENQFYTWFHNKVEFQINTYQCIEALKQRELVDLEPDPSNDEPIIIGTKQGQQRLVDHDEEEGPSISKILEEQLGKSGNPGNSRDPRKQKGSVFKRLGKRRKFFADI